MFQNKVISKRIIIVLGEGTFLSSEAKVFILGKLLFSVPKQSDLLKKVVVLKEATF